MASSRVVNKTGGVEINGQTLFGMDAELAMKEQAKYDYALEREIVIWIEQVRFNLIKNNLLIMRANHENIWALLLLGTRRAFGFEGFT